MEKVNDIPSSPMDIFLLPVRVHKKLSVKIEGLILAFLFVGVFDMVFHQNIIKEGIFQGDFLTLALKLILFLVFSLLLGAVDVICTMVPIAEFAMMIGRRSEKYVSRGLLVIFMKSYALSHLLFIIPSAIYLYSGVDWLTVDMTSPEVIRWLFAVLIVVSNVMPYFQLGIIYRTISIKTRIQVFGKLILVLAMYYWMQLSGEAIVFFESLLLKLL